MKKKYASLALWVCGFEAVALLIGAAMRKGVAGWYRTLAPPPLTPPEAMFPVVWAVLYALIAAAGWIVWRRRSGSRAQFLLFLFVVYIILNWSWNLVFFGAHMMLAAFFWLVALNIVALSFIRKAWNHIQPAALLMMPPTLWTCYAAYLNGGYWWLNR